MKVAKDGAVYKRPDGVVIIDPEKSKGQKAIVDACPIKVIFWNEELQVPQKCTMCAELLDDPEYLAYLGDRALVQPRCVEACPNKALYFGDLDDPNSKVSKLIATGEFKPFMEEYGMKEKVLYKSVPKKFVAGTVIFGDINEVAAGAKVVLAGPDGEQTVVTNGFGDFEFEDLPDNICFTIRIQAPEYKEAVLEAKTSKDVYLGEIKLAR